MNKRSKCLVARCVLLAAPWVSASSAPRQWDESLGDGRPILFEVTGLESWKVGSSFCLAEDLNGDGSPDLLVLEDEVEDGTVPDRVVAVSGKSGKAMWATTIVPEGARGYGSINTWADVDGDGISDVACESFENDSLGSSQKKFVLLSGKSGEILQTVTPPKYWTGGIAWGAPEGGQGSGGWRGFVLEPVSGSENEDGDASIRSDERDPLTGEFPTWTRLRLHSFQGMDLRVDYEVNAPDDTRFYGGASWVNDTCGGIPPYIVCTTRNSEEECLRVRVLRRVNRGDARSDWMWLPELDYRIDLDHKAGTSVLLPDLDGDGVRELAISLPRLLNSGHETRVTILSGATGLVLTELAGEQPDPKQTLMRTETGFGSSMALLGCLGDSQKRFLAIGSKYRDAAFGGVFTYDMPATTLRGISATQPNSNRLGCLVRAGLDFDSDGVPDFATCDEAFFFAQSGAPRIHIFSGRTRELLRSYP